MSTFSPVPPTVTATEPREVQTPPPTTNRMRMAVIGGVAGLLGPLLAIVVRTIGCHYGTDQASDILNALSMCAVPPVVIGAAVVALAAAAGGWLGGLGRKAPSSGNRSRVGARIGLVIGILVALIVGAAFGLATMFPDC